MSVLTDLPEDEKKRRQDLDAANEEARLRTPHKECPHCHAAFRPDLFPIACPNCYEPVEKAPQP